MKKFIYSTLVLAATMSFAGCTNDDDITSIPDSEKEMISFSVGDAAATTRAGFTGADTRIVMRIRSDKAGGNTADVMFTRTVAQAARDVVQGSTDAEKAAYLEKSYSDVTLSGTNVRYWDDAYGRNALLSVFAVAIPNSTSEPLLPDTKLVGTTSWDKTSTSNDIEWTVEKTAQTLGTTSDMGTIDKEDLTYSNNIQKDGKDGVYRYDFSGAGAYPAKTGEVNKHANGQMKFTLKDPSDPSGVGKFDLGHMIFNHAMSRITVVLAKGTGFASNAFKFADGTNIKLINMNTKGSLNVQSGVWTVSEQANIAKMAPEGTYTNAVGSFVAQMLPGYTFADGSDTRVMEFTIDDNTYYITQDMIYDALKVNTLAEAADSKVVMKQGRNYKLTITVDKTKIDAVTASLAEWVEVSGTYKPSNSRITLNLHTEGQACDKNIDLYRLEDPSSVISDTYDGTNWYGNYSTATGYKTTLAKDGKVDGKWDTGWYFESNKMYYHFRTVNSGTSIVSKVDGNNDGDTDDDGEDVNDYFNISAGSQTSTDPHWGAPMKNSATLVYDKVKGYENDIHHAIGSTESDLKIQEIHMMSNVNVILETTDDDAKVNLANAKVEVIRFAKDGQVEMGRGVVTPMPDTDIANKKQAMDAPASDDYWAVSGKVNKTKPFTYAFVPQPLVRATTPTVNDYVGIQITTSDNVYYLIDRLSEITASSVKKGDADYNDPNQAKDAVIEYWYPGHSYVYTIKLTKKGIEVVSCSVADWIIVEGTGINVDLEK